MSVARTIAIVALRLWAANGIILSVSTLTFLVIGAIQNSSELSIANLIVQPLFLVLALLAWKYPATIASFIVPSPPPRADDQLPKLDTETAVTIGTFLVGLYILTLRLPPALLYATRYALNALNPDNQTRYFDVLRLIENLVIAAVALFLFFRASDIARLFVWLRRAAPGPT